jgi:MFS transporter, ACS family, hexuronate transporter
MTTIRNLRWWIAGLLAAATALNYLDRQSFPVLVNAVREDIAISNEDFGRLTSIFFLAYAIMYAGGGRLMDWLGVRAGYVVVIVWWSAANVLTGFVSSLLGLGTARFLLGLGEGGGFPGSAKAVAEWFPQRERAMAFGIFNTGSAVGAVMAPPLLALIVTQWGWRWAFYLTGGAGFIWAVAWWKCYRPPQSHARVSDEERRLIADAHAEEQSRNAAAGDAPAMRWRDFFRIPEVRGLMVAKFLSDAAWFFFSVWLARYLGDVRGLDIKKIGYFAWIPYAFAGAGSMMAGLGTAWLLRRGIAMDRTRRIVLAASAALLPTSLLITASPLSYAIVIFSAMMFGHQCFASIVQTIPTDLFPSRYVGSVGGLLGSAGSFGAMLFNLLVGWLVERQGYAIPFVFAGLMHPIAFLIIHFSVRRIEQLPLPRRPEG